MADFHGTSGNDSPIATADDDFFFLSAGNDTLGFFGNGTATVAGGAGDDTLTGLGGDDLLSGGWGTDVAVYFGNRADYDVVTNGFRTDMTHLNGGWEGHDLLAHVEILRFADGDLILLPQAAALRTGGPDRPRLRAGRAIRARMRRRRAWRRSM